MNKLKKVSIVWGIVVFIIFGLLTTMGFIYKKKTAKYKKLENKLVELAKTYTATDFKFPMAGEEIIVTYKELKEHDLIKKLEIDKKTCDGYVKLTFNGVTEYKGYVICDKYKTHGFENNKLD